jgi:hypothetical protein
VFATLATAKILSLMSKVVAGGVAVSFLPKLKLLILAVVKLALQAIAINTRTLIAIIEPKCFFH